MPLVRVLSLLLAAAVLGAGAAYAIAGLEIALLDLKGKALGAPVVELLGGVCSDRVPVVGYLFIDEPEANARKAAAFAEAGTTELKLKVGRDFAQDHDTIAAIRDAVGRASFRDVKAYEAGDGFRKAWRE